MQTLSAVSCQRSAVSCRSFCTRVHAFGTSPALQKPHYLYVFCTTDTTSTTTTTTTHPITMYHTHPPLQMIHHYIKQPPAMYQMCHHHHLSDTHNLSALASLFISHMLHFARSYPITIYTLSSRAPTHHTFLCLFTHRTYHLRTAQIVLDIQHHRCGWQLTPILRQKPSITGANTTRCKPCQLSAVSRQLSAGVHFAQGSTPLGRFPPS